MYQKLAHENYICPSTWTERTENLLLTPICSFWCPCFLVLILLWVLPFFLDDGDLILDNILIDSVVDHSLSNVIEWFIRILMSNCTSHPGKETSNHDGLQFPIQTFKLLFRYLEPSIKILASTHYKKLCSCCMISRVLTCWIFIMYKHKGV